jgi:hypothetical protein
MKTNTWYRIAVIAVIVTLGASASFAQNPSNPATITLTATVNESISLNLSSGTVAFGTVDLVATNSGGPVTLATNWRVRGNRNSLEVCAYFAALGNRMTGATSGDVIPAAAVQIDTGSGLNSVNGNCSAASGLGVAGLSRTLASYDLTALGRRASAVESLAFNLDLSASPTLNADDYTGTLTLRASAFN